MNDSELEANETNLFEEGYIPFRVYTYQLILYPMAFCIFVPLNLFVAFVLLTDKTLHNARNAIWLGVIASNLTVFFMASLKYFIFYQQSYIACQLHSFVFGKPYTILLVNLLLATCDRFIYTRWPLFHQVHVTVTRVVIAQFLCSVSAFLALSTKQFVEVTPFRCGTDPQTGKVLAGATGTLTLLCIVAKLVVYFMAKKDMVARNQHGVVLRQIRTANLKRNPEGGGIIREISRPSLRVHHAGREFRRMERNATMTLVASLIPMSLFVSLTCLYVLSQMICRQFYDKCEMLLHLETYFRELAVLHVCTDLLVYVFRSLEFRSAAKNLFLGSAKPSASRQGAV